MIRIDMPGGASPNSSRSMKVIVGSPLGWENTKICVTRLRQIQDLAATGSYDDLVRLKSLSEQKISLPEGCEFLQEKIDQIQTKCQVLQYDPDLHGLVSDVLIRLRPGSVSPG